MEITYEKALQLDTNDLLRDYKSQFVNDENMIYLDGNSLGKLPKQTIELTSNIVQQQWGNRLIRSWNENWMDLSSRIATKIATIVGAREDEIFVGDSTSLNLYKLAFAALYAKPEQHKIVSDELNFPTDLYVIQGLVKHQFNNHFLELVKSDDGITIQETEIEKRLDKQTALITLSHVAYKSAFMYNMELVNKLAYENNSLVIWDLSHAAGAVPVELNKSGADMAVGCTYKYLNGGPGAPAYLYVRKDLQEKFANPITSWFSHQKPFDFDLNYQAIPTIHKFAVGTPNVISMAAIEPGLDISIEAGISKIRAKSIKQTNFMMELIEQELIPLGFTVATPKNERIRGSHISIQHADAYRINRAMIEPQKGEKVVIPDFRPPNNIRLGIAPLYTSYSDIYQAIGRIKTIMEQKEYEKFSNEKLSVT
ncbi:MAG: kynureninase [Bacteroidales bacterium]|nr:kynureninase [Bacteroidales bacterium]